MATIAQLTNYGESEGSGAISPDGRQVATADPHRAGEATAYLGDDRVQAQCLLDRGIEVVDSEKTYREDKLLDRTGEFTATWYDQFPGGCVTSRLHLTTDPNGEFAAQAPQVLGFTTRAALQETLSQRSDGQLQLDPGEAR